MTAASCLNAANLLEIVLRVKAPPPSKLQFRDQYFTWGGVGGGRASATGAGSPGKVLLHSNGKKCLQTCVWRENRPKKKKQLLVRSFARFPGSAEEHT